MNKTDRFEQILSALVEYTHLKTGDFYALLKAESENQKRYVRDSLLNMAKPTKRRSQLLRTRPIFKSPSAGGRFVLRENLYWLSEAGLRQAQEAGLDPDGMGKANDEKGHTILEHENEISDFHLTLNRKLGESTWWKQTDIRFDFSAGYHQMSINPDALLYCERFYFFLEIEKSKQGKYKDGESGLLKKLRCYHALFDRVAQSWRQKWPEMEGFYVLVVVANQIRKRNLIASIREKIGSTALIWVATENEYRNEILGPHWIDAKDGAHSLRVST